MTQLFSEITVRVPNDLLANLGRLAHIRGKQGSEAELLVELAAAVVGVNLVEETISKTKSAVVASSCEQPSSVRPSREWAEQLTRFTTGQFTPVQRAKAAEIPPTRAEIVAAVFAYERDVPKSEHSLSDFAARYPRERRYFGFLGRETFLSLTSPIRRGNVHVNALHTTFDDCARRSLPYRSEEEWSRQERRDYSIAVAWGWDLVLTRDMEPLGRWRGDGCYKTRNVWLQRLRFLEANPDERELFAAELARLRARFDEIVLAERKNPQAFIPRVEPLVEETEALVTWRDSVQTSRHEPAVHQSKRWERNIETERRRARTGNQAFRELVDW